MLDLSSLVDLPPAVALSEVTSINNAAQVIAIAPIPEPEISALFLAGLAFIELVAR